MELSLQKAQLELIQGKLISRDRSATPLSSRDSIALDERPRSLSSITPGDLLTRELTPNELREEIKLENSEETDVRRIKVNIAELLITRMKEELERLNAISVKYYGMLGKDLKAIAAKRSKQALEAKDLLLVRSGDLPLFKIGSRTTIDKFIKVLEFVAKKNDIEQVLDDEIIALAAYKATSEDGFLSNLPDGLFDNNTEVRKGVLVRHYMLDIARLSTAREIETCRGIKEGMLKARLDRLFRGSSVPELLKLDSAFGSLYKGEDPPIREWQVYSNKWQETDSRELAKRACAWFLRFGIKVVKTEEGNLSFDVEKIKSISWAQALLKHDLRSMHEYCESANNGKKIVELGAEGLNLPKPIGINGEPLLPWEITSVGMWQEVDKETGRMLIDDVTDYLIANLRKSNPELFEKVDHHGYGTGELNPKEASKFKWYEAYNLIANGCLDGSKTAAPEALKRRLPRSFGWGKNQLKPYQIKIDDMWEGEGGKVLFRKSVACALRESGLGTFSIHNNELIYTFNKAEFETWYETEIRQNNKNNVIEFLAKHGLSGGFRYKAGSISGLLKILFNVPAGTELELAKCRSSEKVKETIKDLLTQEGDQLKISLGIINETEKETILQEGCSEKFDIPISKKWTEKAERPFLDYGICIKGRYSSRNRFSVDGTNLEKLFGDTSRNPLKDSLDKMQSIFLSSNFELRQFGRIEALLKPSKKFSDQDFINVLTVISQNLDDINFRSDTPLKDNLRNVINETLEDPRRLKAILEEAVTNSKKEDNTTREIFHNASPLDALEHILDFLGQAMTNHEISKLRAGRN